VSSDSSDQPRSPCTVHVGTAASFDSSCLASVTNTLSRTRVIVLARAHSEFSWSAAVFTAESLGVGTEDSITICEGIPSAV